MKIIGRRVALGLVFSVLLIPTWALAAVGRTPGSFAVSNSGAATYTIPIWAPAGPKGIQPNISLVYNSQAGNGYLGVGWNVGGLSSIYRCNLTYAQDAAPAPVSLSTGDGYCLDGQRLRLTSGTYGTAGSTYQTEIANFQNVTAYGTAGNGPSYFVVQTPDGHTLQYGNGGNSQVLQGGTCNPCTATAWMLSKVSDPPGNTMTITYSTATGTVVPNVISWTPTVQGGGSYAYTMTFAYGTNVQPTAGYVAGTPVQNPDLLSTITIAYSGTQVKQYVLTYQQSAATGRDRLTQVQECATSTSNCLYPTAITYQNGSAGISSSPTTVIGTHLPNSWGSFADHYDLNGDGYTDLVYTVGGTWYVAFGSASGYGTPVNTGLTGSLDGSLLVGDLLGTGKAGILANNSGTWYYYTWNGSSFVGTTTGLAFDSTAVWVALADINGDGLPDLVTFHGPSSVTVTTRLNTSSGGIPSFSSSLVTALTDGTHSSAWLITPDNQPGNLKFFDFNGDGRQDLAIQETDCIQYLGTCTGQYVNIIKTLVSQAGGTFLATPVNSYTNTGSTVGGTAFANLNNDSCTDIVANQTSVIYSACNGAAAITVTPTYPVVGVIDWNGDGIADLLENNGGTLYVQLATGTGFSAATSTALAFSGNCSYVALDVNGDGLDDLGCTNSFGTSAPGFQYYPHNGTATPPDLLTAIVDGYGNSASPTYVSIVRGNYTVGTGAYPNVPYAWPLYVSNVVTFSDPSSTSGATYNQTFNYYGSQFNVQGRGWDGFAWIQQLDSRNSLYDTRYFLISFPYTGMKYQDSLTNSSITLFQSTGTPAVTNLSTTAYQQRYFPYFSNMTAKRWELGGSENGDLITTQSTNYTYDNYGNATTLAQTITDNDPGSPYSGDTWTITTTNTTDASTSPWCLNLFTQTQVVYTASIGNAVTRTKQFTPDLTNCRYTQIVTEPSNGTYKVTEAVGYDAFGNVNSDSVTGVGMSARQTTLSWTSSGATTGQFPISVTDPSGAQTQFSYNYSFGVPSSTIDPNGLTTSWQYTDGFGRKTQETRPDGTYTIWQYLDSSSYTSFHGLLTANTVYGNTGSQISNGDVATDPIGRTFATATQPISGYARIDTRYDSLGRTIQQSAPCVFSSWSTACTYWTTTTYDALNRPTQVQRPISSTNSTLETFAYAYAGRKVTVTDPNSNATMLISDVNGWRRQTQDPLSYAVTFAYDAAGARTSVTDSLGNTLWSGGYAYGLQPFLTSETDMDRGAWSYVYDALGEKTSWTDAKSQHFAETYDSLSRPLTRTDPDLFSKWVYGSSAGSHNWGQLQSDCTGTGSACNASGYSESFTYDSLGRRYQRAVTIPSTGTYTYTWQYSTTTGLLSSLTYPTSTSGYALTLQYGYSNGVLQSVTDTSDSPNVAVWTGNTENAAGQYTEETLGNGVVTNRSYDAVTHWLGTVTAGVGGGATLQNQSFLFDEVGNVTQRQDNNRGLTENFYYDNDYRLSYTKLNGTQNFSVTYNAMGDITSRSDILSGASWTYDPTHKHQALNLGGASTYVYDANGNVTSRGGGTIGWSSYNYPTAATVVSAAGSETTTFAYAPDRSRWMQGYSSVNFGNAATTYYIGGLLELVNSGGVNTYRHYIYAGTEPVAVYSRTSSGTNAFNYFLSDHEGTIAGITTSAGTLVVAESYTPFGVRRVPTTWVDPSITSTGWTNQVSDADMLASTAVTQQGYTFQTGLGLFMGLNHMNGRVQDAISGRFLSADPYGTNDNNTQSFNRYSYATNNPLTFNDPTGFDQDNYVCQNGNINCAPVADLQDNMQTVYITATSLAGSIAGYGLNASAVNYTPATAAPGYNAPTGGAAPAVTLPPKKSCVNAATRVVQGAVGAVQAAAGLVQAIGGLAEAVGSIAEAPETSGVSLTAFSFGTANYIYGASAIADGALLINSAINGTGNAPTIFAMTGSQYGGEAGGQFGEIFTAVAGLTLAAVEGNTSRATTAAVSIATMAASYAGTICGQ